MRRWFAILLLLSMPFQSGWAVVAAYCGHESGEAAQHFGHHEHHHTALQGDPAEAAQAQPGASLLDVADCHGHCACAVLLPVSVSVPVIATGSRPAARAALGASPPVRARPERPQWRHLA